MINAEKTRLLVGNNLEIDPSFVLPTSDQQYLNDQTLKNPELLTPSTIVKEPKPPLVPLKIGDTLKNRFEIVELLGEGGMGQVFKAIDIRKLEAKSRNPYLAIKVLNPELARNVTLIAALQRECEKAQALSHPNIITVFDFDRDGNYVFMSMEYLVGNSLASIIRETGRSGGMPLKDAWPIIQKMGEALAYAHQMNIIHSDFKPANVFITNQQQVKVLDFGIASRVDHNGNDETIFDPRMEGAITLSYASFEMFNGSRADPRDDIYSFGLVVYELLTGTHPYKRKSASTVFLELSKKGRATPKPVEGLNHKQWQLLKSSINILQEQRPAKLDDWLLQFNPQTEFRSLKRITGVVALLAFCLAGFAYWRLLFNPIDKSLPSPPENNASRSVENAPVITSPYHPPYAVPPVADVVDKELVVDTHQLVNLNASPSHALDGGALRYQWQLIQKPAVSAVSLNQSNNVTANFTPDVDGEYRVELVVTDAINQQSAPVSVFIKAKSANKELSDTSMSADGVVSLASSKASYRIGESLLLNLRVRQAGYLRVAYISSQGEVSEIFPNQFQSVQVKSAVDYRIPPKGNSFKMQIAGPVGIDQIVAVFSPFPFAKIKNTVSSDGMLNSALQNLTDSTARIQFKVID